MNNPFLLSNVIVLILIHSSIIWFKSKYKNMTYVLNVHDIKGVKFAANGRHKIKGVTRLKL